MKKMKTVMIAGCLLVNTISGISQEYADFDISTYKTPDIVRNALDFSLHSVGSLSDYQSSDNDSYSIDGELGVEFNRLKNTRDFIGTHTLLLNTGADFYNDQGSDNKKRNYNFDIGYTNSSRFYNQNKLFFQTGGTVSFNAGGTKVMKPVTNKSKSDNIRISASVPLYVGKGRIENVTEARQAVYVLENLTKRDVLTRKLSDREVTELATIMSAVKNKRFLDSRLRMIEEISTIDSFFVSNNLLKVSNASYFTTLYDFWMYGGLFERKSGMEIYGGLDPSIRYNKYKLENNGVSKHTVPEIKADIQLKYEEPVNIYWQRSACMDLYGGYRKEKLDYDEAESINKEFFIGQSGSYTWGYYPNSRTNVNFGGREYVSWYKDNLERTSYPELSYADKVTVKTLSASVEGFINTYYYFSPQLRLEVYAGLVFSCITNKEEYEYSPEPYKKEYYRWGGNFNVTLTYSLF